jgi:hypothetical protein
LIQINGAPLALDCGEDIAAMRRAVGLDCEQPAPAADQPPASAGKES